LGYNAIIITLDKGADSVIAECERRGIYVVVRTPIDTTTLGDTIRRGGNPSNDPEWSGLYLSFNDQALHLTKGYGAVVAYAIAKGKTTGVNIYDTYLYMKHFGEGRFVIYEGANGEWCSDKL
jgi:beta-galactosidase